MLLLLLLTRIILFLVLVQMMLVWMLLLSFVLLQHVFVTLRVMLRVLLKRFARVLEEYPRLRECYVIPKP